MAKKKKISNAELITFYMDYVLMYKKHPKSVYAFAKDNDFDEQLFYTHYSNFEALEQSIFKAFFDNTHAALENNGDYQSFSARNKLLSFYFTFFENLTANRSYVVYALENKSNKMKSLKMLAHLKKSFTNFIEHLNIKAIAIEQEQLDKIQNRSIKESAWLQLLVTIKFWLDDTSTSFEKTDIFIEKSTAASFDLIDISPLKGIIDFGKFLFKEKMQSN